MSRYSIAPAARQDIEDIHRYIAKDNRRAARGVVDKLYDTFAVVALQPEMGTTRSELGEDLLTFTATCAAHSYVIFYRTQLPEIEIVRVIHGARDYARFFD